MHKVTHLNHWNVPTWGRIRVCIGPHSDQGTSIAALTLGTPFWDTATCKYRSNVR